ncbi:MAG: DUF167 domain-containing protein [Spirochaetaceae bacterium]|jgi:uncharacterized protein (TIGR00251 family)|nr:DUF167 domain-containing protein [Spirochaetaceae bacterium]
MRKPPETCLSVDGKDIRLRIKVTPASSKSEVMDVREGLLRVKIAAAPEDGKANGALIAFFAKILECPKNQIQLVSGEKSRVKTLSLPPQLAEKITQLISE